MRGIGAWRHQRRARVARRGMGGIARLASSCGVAWQQKSAAGV